jgi:hypothetical protein
VMEVGAGMEDVIKFVLLLMILRLLLMMIVLTLLCITSGTRVIYLDSHQTRPALKLQAALLLNSMIVIAVLFTLHLMPMEVL